MTATDPRATVAATQDVTNQAPPLAGFDPLACDPAFGTALTSFGGQADIAALGPLAVEAGSAQAREHGRLANENPPTLHTHDRYGHRIDEVEFHPSWHWLMSRAVAHGLHAAPWAPDAHAGAHLRRAAGFYLWSQVEAGHGCPISMTYAAVPALRHAPDLADRFEPGLRSLTYDPGLRAPEGKAGLLAGMSMTEKQGGSDVRANTTTATPLADGSYTLVGHKWFTSAPMNDLFLTLAQAPGGLTCFLLPRVLPDGSRNALRLQRLKDKLGNKSNASSEIEYADAVGWRVGDEGRGVRTIIEMVSMTRLDCVLGSAANIRIALSEAAHHAAHRGAFGALLTDQPAMTAVLADLALESEAATTLAMRLATAVDRSQSGVDSESALLRIALPAAKFLVCKRAPMVVAEALECLGGNGYVEESGLPRLYREAPLMSIWEGSGNVTALDVLRALAREPASVDALLGELATTAGADSRLDAAVAALRAEAADPDQSRARRLAELIALNLQGSLLLRHAPSEVAEGFLASRLGASHGRRWACCRAACTPASSPTGSLRADSGALPRRPLVGQPGQRLVAERVHARPDGKGVRDVHVQALDPAGHATRADVGAQRLDRVALRQVRLVRPLVQRGEFLVLREALGHLLHQPARLQRAAQGGQPGAGQVVERRERGPVVKPGAGLHHGRVPARAAVRDRPHRPWPPAQLRADDFRVGRRDRFEHCFTHRDLHPPRTESHNDWYHACCCTGCCSGWPDFCGSAPSGSCTM